MKSAAPPVPLVTVVVPLFNGSAFIVETLSSIDRQTFRDFEVIVVDDGSKDGGAHAVAAHPVGATLIEQSNLGVAVARNRGLAAARGKWVAFLDQDDLWHPTHLERLMSWLRTNPTQQIAFVRETPFTTTDETDQLAALDENAGSWARVRVPAPGSLTELVRVAPPAQDDDVEFHDLRGLLRGPISATSSFIATVEILHLAGGFAPHALAMDDYWLLVNVSRLQSIPQLSQRTVYYRVHLNATSRTTRLGLPFLSSAVALRFGGGLISHEEALHGGLDGKLHRHLIAELRASSEYRSRRFRQVVDQLARVIWPAGGDSRRRWRAHLAARLPWLRTAVKKVRARSRSLQSRTKKVK